MYAIKARLFVLETFVALLVAHVIRNRLGDAALEYIKGMRKQLWDDIEQFELPDDLTAAGKQKVRAEVQTATDHMYVAIARAAGINAPLL